MYIAFSTRTLSNVWNEIAQITSLIHLATIKHNDRSLFWPTKMVNTASFTVRQLVFIDDNGKNKLVHHEKGDESNTRLALL